MTLVVKGLRETQRAFRALDKDLPKVVNHELAEAAEPVAVTVREKLGRFRGAKLNRVRPIVLSGRVVVRQTQTKKTGKRSDFGRTQMRYAFEPALEEHGDDIERRVEAALDRIAHTNGF